MNEHKLNAKFAICLAAIIVVILLAIRCIYMFFTGQIIDEKGESCGKVLDTVFGLLFSIIASSYIYSAITMLRQYIFHSGNAFELTERGIENTMVSINILAFIFVMPVKCIPWDAVKSVSPDGSGYDASVNIKKVKANFLAKLVLLTGYGFCNKFTKEKITEDELHLFGIEIVRF